MIFERYDEIGNLQWTRSGEVSHPEGMTHVTFLSDISGHGVMRTYEVKSDPTGSPVRLEVSTAEAYLAAQRAATSRPCVFWKSV